MEKKIDLSMMPRTELEKFAMEASGEAERLKALVEAKEAELRLLRREKFGSRSEKRKKEETPDENQLSLFNDAEALAQPEAEEPKLEKVRRTRKTKKKGCKKAKLEKLPKDTTEYTLQEEERACPVCGNEMAVMKRTVRKEVEVIPARVVVHEHITESYVCRQCEDKGTQTPIIKAPSPKPMLNASFLSPSMAAYILTRKYDNRDPIYKISSDFAGHGLELSDQMISNWVLRTAEEYGQPLYERMWEHLKGCDYINADETGIQVLEEPGRKAQSKSYMWLFCRNHTEKPLVLYEYAPTRSGEAVKKALEGYQGIVQCDGYDGYNAAEGIVRMGCLAHIRRKFNDAKEALDPKIVKEAGALEMEALKKCGRLFELDEEVKGKPVEERLSWKEQHIRKESDDFFKWLQQIRDKGEAAGALLLKAVNYALNERQYFENYFTDGRIEMSNNLAERAVRPFAMGRKNWLFCRTPRGAKASAIWYSIIVTAKENGLLPFEYLRYLLEELRGKKVSAMPDEQIDRLLPWSGQLPQECYCAGMLKDDG